LNNQKTKVKKNENCSLKKHIFIKKYVKYSTMWESNLGPSKRKKGFSIPLKKRRERRKSSFKIKGFISGWL